MINFLPHIAIIIVKLIDMRFAERNMIAHVLKIALKSQRRETTSGMQEAMLFELQCIK